jgi:hypothetical protein
MIQSEKQKEDWMNSKWRPMMGWMYMFICILDMAVFPVLWSLLQAMQHQTITQWTPLTLQGAGLFHIAMGAVLGIAAYGRTQEKLNGANNGGLATSPTIPTSSPTAPSVSTPVTMPTATASTTGAQSASPSMPPSMPRPPVPRPMINTTN